LSLLAYSLSCTSEPDDRKPASSQDVIGQHVAEVLDDGPSYEGGFVSTLDLRSRDVQHGDPQILTEPFDLSDSPFRLLNCTGDDFEVLSLVSVKLRDDMPTILYDQQTAAGTAGRFEHHRHPIPKGCTWCDVISSILERRDHVVKI